MICTPKVAVITRTKNRPKFLERAADSILNSDYDALEWIVVNDAGEQASVESIVGSVRAAGIAARAIHIDESRGMEHASNVGVRASEAPYVHLHDDDDSVLPTFYSNLVAALEDGTRFVAAASLVVQVNEEVLSGGQIRERSQSLYRQLDAIKITHLQMENPFPPIALVFRREAYESVGGFSESLRLLGDWDFHFRLCMLGDIFLVRQPLSRYHLRPRHHGTPDTGNSIRDLSHDSSQYLAMMDNAAIRASASVDEAFALGAFRRSSLEALAWQSSRSKLMPRVRHFAASHVRRNSRTGRLLARLARTAGL